MVKLAPNAQTVFAEVAIPIPLRQTFTYRVPAELVPELTVGAAVMVPFGRRKVQGFVVALKPESELKQIKEIESLSGDSLPTSILNLAQWIAEYYLASLGEVLRAALPAGLGKKTREREWTEFPEDPPFVLGDEQAEAVKAIKEALSPARSQSFLLHGETGSGKTEVYLRAAEATIAAGRKVLVLIPEIALSQQMVHRFQRRFGDRVALWHSALTASMRREVFNRTRSGDLDILVGARSAILAPLPDVGLIVVDEEHETAYKQGESPRYHARDVALVRGRQEKAVVILGSATPALETYKNAQTGKLTLLRMHQRFGQGLAPQVEIVPLPKKEPRKAAPISMIFGDRLRDELAKNLSAGSQTILFLNRRGHSTVVQCEECQTAVPCRHCDIALTFHASDQRLRCHYCGASRRLPLPCPEECGGEVSVMKGVGTQRVESEVTRLFPMARVLRLDTDTARKRGSTKDTIEKFRRREADILLGTQMVAKGLDFPSVTLVGVINADTQLNLPDFRSAERTFQLLAQVAGRSGRGEHLGRVIFQTNHPDHDALVTAARQDYEEFYKREIARRKDGPALYPPHVRLINLLIDGKKEEAVIDLADKVVRHFDRHPTLTHQVAVLGPAPQPLSRLKSQYRWHITLRSESSKALHELAEVALAFAKEETSSVRLAVDVDPVSML